MNCFVSVYLFLVLLQLNTHFVVLVCSVDNCLLNYFSSRKIHPWHSASWTQNEETQCQSFCRTANRKDYEHIVTIQYANIPFYFYFKVSSAIKCSLYCRNLTKTFLRIYSTPFHIFPTFSSLLSYYSLTP